MKAYKVNFSLAGISFCFAFLFLWLLPDQSSKIFAFILNCVNAIANLILGFLSWRSK